MFFGNFLCFFYYFFINRYYVSISFLLNKFIYGFIFISYSLIVNCPYFSFIIIIKYSITDYNAILITYIRCFARANTQPVFTVNTLHIYFYTNSTAFFFITEVVQPSISAILTFCCRVDNFFFLFCKRITF